MILTTDRLILRPWKPGDRTPFAAMNADPRVMEFFPATMSRVESDAQADRIEAHFENHGFGFWALEAPGQADFIGLAGLAIPRFTAHFTPCVEIGWQLSYIYRGKGYATEAAQCALRYGFEEKGFREIVSFTTVTNRRSRAVMERIGMHRNAADDFDHPSVEDGSPLKRHVLYRIQLQCLCVKENTS